MDLSAKSGPLRSPTSIAEHLRESTEERVSPLTPHSSLLTPHSSLLTPHSSLLTPHSSLLTPHSSLLTPHSSLLTPHSSLLTPHSSLLTPHSSLLTPHSSLLTPHSSLLTPHSSLLTPHSSLLTPHSSLLTPHSSLLTPHSSLLTKPHSSQSSGLGNHNYCRNPDRTGLAKSAWCYTNNPKKRWENCRIPSCNKRVIGCQRGKGKNRGNLLDLYFFLSNFTGRASKFETRPSFFDPFRTNQKSPSLNIMSRSQV